MEEQFFITFSFPPNNLRLACKESTCKMVQIAILKKKKTNIEKLHNQDSKVYKDKMDLAK